MDEKHNTEHGTINKDAFLICSVAEKMWKQLQNHTSDAPAYQTSKGIGDQVIYICGPESKHLKNLDG